MVDERLSIEVEPSYKGIQPPTVTMKDFVDWTGAELGKAFSPISLKDS